MSDTIDPRETYRIGTGPIVEGLPEPQSPLPRGVQNWREIATLRVNNLVFHDWESVWVKINWADGWPEFRFTAAERDPVPNVWDTVQFRPGDFCAVDLAGQQAVNGIILNRQVAYDATNHGVQLYGRGLQWAAASSSGQSETGSFDNMTFEAIARKVLAPYPSGIQVVGMLDPTIFDKVQQQPGELNFDFLEKLARVRGIVLGSDHLGNHLLIGEHTMPVVQQLIEGYNILKLQSVWNIEWKSQLYAITGQHAGSDDSNMADAALKKAQIPGTMPVFKYFEQVVEQNVKKPTEMQMRAYYEAIWREGSELTVTATVQGWLRDGVNLWRAGENVYILSPMAILDFVMKIQSVTYTQDSKGGTTTTLELVMPWALRGGSNYKMGGPAMAPVYADAKTDTEPPKAPKKDETKDEPEIKEPAVPSTPDTPPDSSFIGAP